MAEAVGSATAARSVGHTGLDAASQRVATAFSAVLQRGYWQARFVDRHHGGFAVADRAGLLEAAVSIPRLGPLPTARWLRAAASPARRDRVEPQSGKHLIAHARLVWSLSHLLRHGLSPDAERCLAAAEHGYRFLLDVMLDSTAGGFFWRADSTGRVIDHSKLLVGQAFAIYALVEYGRVTGDERALATALETFRQVHSGLHDVRSGGWHDIGDRNLRPRRQGPVVREPGFRAVPGAKSVNGHLHWMEALTELCRESRDGLVVAALEESIEINRERFARPLGGRLLVTADAEWRPLDGENDEVSYGHLLELAWLLVEAETTVGREPSWRLADALVDDSVEWGFDRGHGGFYLAGPFRRPARRTDKLWWVQAEGAIALWQRWRRSHEPRVGDALAALVDWVVTRQLDLRRGTWIWATDAAGRPSNFVRASSWKAGYHEVRAMTRLLEAAGGERVQLTSAAAGDDAYGR